VFGGLTLDKVSPALVSNYKDLRAGEARPATIRNELVCLKHAFNLAVAEWQWIKANPIITVKMPIVENKIDRWLTDKEESALFAACYDREWLKDVITFSLHTGVRQGALISLKLSDIDF
jgi:integrase